ncbi:hypothetical protein ES319_D11G001000v1 [Gossypium barbadense]|uniref:Uncharacterized protein n=1 Tax=Gossypium barbadense TaxID=3634 RepID=A0A5J5P563_GOSBA|nr:hypothetical protein ES319_D11G001000v1 [Gossypium barbadense]
MEEKSEYKKGLWSAEEDSILMEYVRKHGKGKWNRIPKVTGLKRCGKSCRLRWINYLSPGVKRGRFSDQENDLIIRLHNLLGNRWSLIAGRVPGRTDNQVKNHWNTHLSKKLGIIKNPTAHSSQFQTPSKSSRDDDNSHSQAQDQVMMTNTDALPSPRDYGNGSSSRFWQCHNNDHFNLHTPTPVNVLDLLDHDHHVSLDFVWHGFA